MDAWKFMFLFPVFSSVCTVDVFPLRDILWKPAAGTGAVHYCCRHDVYGYVSPAVCNGRDGGHGILFFLLCQPRGSGAVSYFAAGNFAVILLSALVHDACNFYNRVVFCQFEDFIHVI